MKKKRLSLAEFRREPARDTNETREEAPDHSEDTTTKAIHTSVYIAPAVMDQLNLLALQERPGPGRRKKFNTLVMEGLDLLFKSRGLPGTEDLLGKK